MDSLLVYSPAMKLAVHINRELIVLKPEVKMDRPRHEIGMVNGRKYKLRYDQRQNVHHCDYRRLKSWRWFLWVDGYYQGDFNLKRDAIEHIENM